MLVQSVNRFCETLLNYWHYWHTLSFSPSLLLSFSLHPPSLSLSSVLKMGEMMDMLYSAGKVTSSEVEAVQKYIQAYTNDPVVRHLYNRLSLFIQPILCCHYANLLM